MAREPEPIAAGRRSLGERLATFRMAAGLTQAQLARATFCDRTQVTHIERGRSRADEQFWSLADEICRADGALLAGFYELRAATRDHEQQVRDRELKAIQKKVERYRSIDLNSDGSAAAGESEIVRSRKEWLHVRQSPGVRGRELTELAAWLYPESQRAPGGHVLAGPGWLLPKPVELDSVRITRASDAAPAPALVSLSQLLPLTDRGERYADYSRAVRDLVRPRLLENRHSYRLTQVDTSDGLALTFGMTTFFEVFNVKQSVAHEFKAAWLSADGSLPQWENLSLRQEIDNPFDPSRLLMSPGISTLTIRRGQSGAHRFFLHERDGGKVADGGGLCHVIPAGEFQPSSVAAEDADNDFSLWHNIVREFSEEFLGNPEHDGNGARSVDYLHDEPFSRFEKAKQLGSLRMWYYGLVVEPLELGAGQLTVAVVDDDVFDTLFATMTRTNDEGRLIGAHGRIDLPFTREAIDRLEPRLSASALTLLRMAWRDRELLLST